MYLSFQGYKQAPNAKFSIITTYHFMEPHKPIFSSLACMKLTMLIAGLPILISNK